MAETAKQEKIETPYYSRYVAGESVDAIAENDRRDKDYVLTELVKECQALGKNQAASNFARMIQRPSSDGVVNIGDFDLS